MKKKKIIIEVIIMSFLTIAIAVYAYIGKNTHTDYSRDLISKIEGIADDNTNDKENDSNVGYDDNIKTDSWINDGVTYYVAEMPEELIAEIADFLLEEYVKSPYIIKCTVLESVEPSYNAMRVPVKVDKVYAGEDISVGEEIIIANEHSSIMAKGENIYLEIGFHNFMLKGEEYLVFLKDHMDINEEKYGNVFRMEGFTFPAYFLCGEDKKCECVPLAGGPTYVKYSDVINNEFFCENEKALEIIRSMKHKMLEKYN